LEAVFNVKEIDDFAVACAFGGSLQIIKLYAKMLYIKSKRKLKKMYQLLAQADVLCKNAYNNTHLSLEVKRVAESVEHYRQFEVVTAYESLDMVNNLIRRHRTKIENILQHFN
jgi:hypothetical protein